MFNSFLVIDKLNIAENFVIDLKNSKDKYAKYFIFILIMQNIIDISFLLIINLKLKKPKNYLEIFDILSSSSIITQNTALSLRSYSALRNKIIYNYNNIDDNEYKIMINKFENHFSNFNNDIRCFIKTIS